MGHTRHLTDATIRGLSAPAKGNVIVYDDTVTGLGIRTTAAGHKAFILGYTTRAGRQRRYTIGTFNDPWLTAAARVEAKRLKMLIDQGGDPLQDIQAEREAPDMRALVERFKAEHFPRLRASSAVEYDRMIANYVLKPKGQFSENTKVADIGFDDIDALHRKVTKLGYEHRANRLVAVLSKMFALAVRWKMRTDNPCKGVTRNREHARQRYMKPDELVRIVEALRTFPDKNISDALKLLLLTGARKGEVCAMQWEHLDLTAGTWSKPPTGPSGTKQKRHHRVPLSAPARALLAERLSKRADGEPFVFPGRGAPHLTNIWHAWQRICKTAGVKNLRPHDIRHSYASALASAGHNLPLIGALLGHSQASTTQRYAHLFDDPLRRATEQVGAVIANAGQPARAAVPLKRAR